MKTASAVAAVIHAASDQALREPEQANETGRDDQQSQGSSGERELKTTQRAKAPSWKCWPLKACADATALGCRGSCGFAGGFHRTAGERSVGVVTERSMAFGTSEHHLDGWNRRPRSRCGGGSPAAMSQMLRPLSCVVAAGAGLLLVWEGAAQTNEDLLRERLISPTVFELLQRRGATTPEQRLQVIGEACRSGQLGEADCPQLRPRQY